MAATSASLRRSEWSPSTKEMVTGPGMAATWRSSSAGEAKASLRPETNKQGRSSCGEMLGPQSLRLARRMERIAHQHQGGDVEALGDGERAHTPAE